MKNKKENDSKNLISLIPTYLLLILIVILPFIKLPWSVYAPGGTININERLTNIEYETKGEINMTYVSFIKGNIATLLAGLIFPSWDIVSNDEVTYEGQDLEETDARDAIAMKSAISNATKYAYTYAEKKLNIDSTSMYITYIYDKTATKLKVGDEILKYDQIKATTFEELNRYIQTKKIDDIIEIEVNRKGKNKKVKSRIIAIDNKPKLGIGTSIINNYNKNTVNYKTKDNESGSSCGLMLTLSIYNSITKKDITKGRIICGTGTIEDDGTVGKIGGIKYKLLGAKKDKCDVFLVPRENYKEAKDVIKKHNINMNVYEVNTFEEALTILNN